MKTLSDCFKYLDDLLCDEDKEYIFNSEISLSSKINSLHHTLGRHIRNTFGLWHGSNISILIKEKHNIIHPDDQSSFILTEYINGIGKK